LDEEDIAENEFSLEVEAIKGERLPAGHISSSNDVLGEEEFGRDLGRVEESRVKLSENQNLWYN
jgi:hypothetical protein